MKNKVGYCRFCGKPIEFVGFIGLWFHITSTKKVCEDQKNFAKPENVIARFRRFCNVKKIEEKGR